MEEKNQNIENEEKRNLNKEEIDDVQAGMGGACFPTNIK